MIGGQYIARMMVIVHHGIVNCDLLDRMCSPLFCLNLHVIVSLGYYFEMRFQFAMSW
jgi:hypothetical protein